MEILKGLVVVLLGAAPVWSADWLTDGGNTKRTAWQQDERTFSKATIDDTRLLWKIELDNKPREMHSLFPPLIAEGVKTATGLKEIALVAGVSDNLYAIDVETGSLLWKRNLQGDWRPPDNYQGWEVLCPGGLTATPVISPSDVPGEYIVYAASWDGRLHRINLADGKNVVPPAKFMPPNGKPYALNLFKNVKSFLRFVKKY